MMPMAFSEGKHVLVLMKWRPSRRACAGAEHRMGGVSWLPHSMPEGSPGAGQTLKTKQKKTPINPEVLHKAITFLGQYFLKLVFQD